MVACPVSGQLDVLVSGHSINEAFPVHEKSQLFSAVSAENNT